MLCAVVLLTTIPGRAVAAEDGWTRLPVLPSMGGGVKESFLKDVARSRRFGMRPRVFAKLGDSNTEMASSLYGLGCRKAKLYGYSHLRAVIDRYNLVRLPNSRPMPACSPGTSFSRHSAAAQIATVSPWSITRISELPPTGIWAPPPDCLPSQSPISCEINLIRPRYVLIMTGTNDVGLDRYLEAPPGQGMAGRMDLLIKTVRSLGSVPVVSTLPPLITPDAAPNAIAPYNVAIAKSARRNGVPLINLWRALNAPSMINSGMEDLGLHLRTLAGGESPFLPDATTLEDSVDFSPRALRTGSNRRNLIWLQTLARLDEAAAG